MHIFYYLKQAKQDLFDTDLYQDNTKTNPYDCHMAVLSGSKHSFLNSFVVFEVKLYIIINNKKITI